MIGGSLDFSCLSRTGVGFGGSVGVARLGVTANQRTLSLANPHGIPEPKESVLKVDAEAIESISLNYGVPLSFCPYAQKDMLILADGIAPLKVYNGGIGGYELGIVAPKAAPTATDLPTPPTRMFPISTVGTPCEGGSSSLTSFFSHHWNGTSLILTAPQAYCDGWQSLDDLTDDEWVRCVQGAPGNTSNGITRVGQYRLDAPSFEPDSDSGHAYACRLKYQESGSPFDLGYHLSFRVSLMQGTTEIKGTDYTEADIEAVTPGGNFESIWKTFTVSLTSGEAAAITDYTDLRLKISVSPRSGAGDPGHNYQLRCSQIYLDIPAPVTGPTQGSYGIVYTYVRSATGVESGPSPLLDFTHETDTCFEIGGLLLSEDPTVDFINVYSTTNGGETYFLLETVPSSNDSLWNHGGGTEGTDLDSQDPTLYADAVIRCADDVGIALGQKLNIAQKRVYESGLPPRGRFLKGFNDRIWTAGALLDAPYTAGLATFTNGSTTVTGIGTHWASRMVGRSIKAYTAPDSQKYTIAKVVSETEILLTTAFEESTVTEGFYVIRDDNRNPNTLYWSYPGFPEDWPVTNGLTIEGEDNEGITGLAILLGRLLVFRRDGIYGVSGNSDTTFQIDPIYRGIGCVDGHTIVEAGNYVLFLDSDGWYYFDGSGPPVPISSPDAQNGQVTGIDRDVARINPAKSKWACALYSDRDRTFRSFVALDGNFESNHAVVYDSTVRTWAIDDMPGVSAYGSVLDENDEKVHLIGTVEGCLFQLDRGLSDGVFNGSIVAQVTSSTNQVITCADASFDLTHGLMGCPVYLVDPYGGWTRVRAQNNTGTQISLLFPLNFIPTTDYTVVVGGIPWLLRSGFYHYLNPHKPTVLQYEEIAYTPETQGRIHMRASSDFRSLHLLGDSVDLTSPIGLGRVNVRHKSRFIQTEIFSLLPGFEIEVNNLEQFLLIETGGVDG